MMALAAGIVREPTLHITEDIIRGSTKRSTTRCMIARAVIQQIVGSDGRKAATNIVVSDGHVKYSLPEFRTRMIFALPAWARKKIEEFDCDKEVKPFKLRLFQPLTAPMSAAIAAPAKKKTSSQRGKPKRSPRACFTTVRSYGHRRFKVLQGE